MDYNEWKAAVLIECEQLGVSPPNWPLDKMCYTIGYTPRETAEFLKERQN